MLREGEGFTAPAPVSISLSAGEMEYLRSVATRREQYRAYSQRSDKWGRGYIDSPIFVGLCGEHAVCTFLNRRLSCRLSVDTKLRGRGDGGVDVDVFGVTLQVKTRARGDRNLVRRVDRKGIRGLNVIAYVFCQLLTERRTVLLLGWIKSDELRTYAKSERSPVDVHFNLSVDAKYLRPMNSLLDEIQLRRVG